MSAPRLSALVVARNEEAQLPDCLATLRFADEIVVVLDRSTDRSREIAEAVGARIVEGAWPIEGERRQAGVDACSGDWIVEVDADERVPEALAREIRRAVETADAKHFLIPFDNYVGDRLVKYGWGASFGVLAATRLYAKGAKRWGNERVHPSVKFDGPGRRLETAMVHYVDRDVGDMIDRLRRYSLARAADLNASDAPLPPLISILRRSVSRFLKCYLFRKGYREGRMGVMLALMAGLFPLLSHLIAQTERETPAGARGSADPVTGPRVLQAIAGGEHGGAERFFVRLVGALARAGVEQRVLVRRGRSWGEEIAALGVPVRTLGFGGALDLVTRRRFARQIDDFAPQVVLTWMSRATRFCPRSEGNRPPFVHAARLGGYYDLKYYRHCDHLIGNTLDLVRYFRSNGWSAERTHYLPNFVDATPMPAVSRASLETAADARVVLALGRLHRNKAFDVLLRALAKLPDVVLWLAGEGPERARLEALAGELGVAPRVRWLGWRADVGALMAACDAFACPSRIEPLGNVVIEAWAHDAPVVAAASVGPAALIASGETGLLVPLEDAEALANSLRVVLDNPALVARLREAGRKVYEASFTEEAVVAAYRRFFERVASPCAASPG